jgi:serpin B
MPGATHRPAFVLLVAAVLIAGCGAPDLSPSAVPSATAGAEPTVPIEPSTAVEPTATPSQGPTITPVPADPFLGHVVVTVSDGLRVRSQPRVSDDSLKYEPLLPLSTELQVIDGPVIASGYVWYKVTPVSFSLRDGPGNGWVAMAGKDGEAWIALAGGPLAGIELAQSSVVRAPAVPAAAKTAAASINAFGLDLLRAMLAEGTLKPDENAVFSPTSIALALAMARAGAKGETASQMDAVLHTSGWDELATGLNALDQALAQRNGTWQDPEYMGSTTHELTLRIANSAFAQQDWTIERAYLDRIASTFGAGARLVDYVANVEAARKLINAWVSDVTRQRIPELIAQGILSEMTRLVLVNAIYLKANWAREFDPAATKSAPFTRRDDSTVNVPTMTVRGEQDIPYAHGTGWRATELRYRGPEYTTPLAMTLILPDDLAAFEQGLTAAQLGRIVEALDGQREILRVTREEEVPGADFTCPTYAYELQLFMPRFSTESRALLRDLLKALGMPLAVDSSAADFTGITESDRIFISQVVHQANIDVDEKGTEAAAATAVMVDTTGGCGPASPRQGITLRLDHPFLFVLRDVETGAVLFMGRVVDPSVGRTGS